MTRSPNRRSRLTGAILWAPGLLVALGAAVATAHGLYEVAADAGVPHPIAWLYPLITDGLALSPTPPPTPDHLTRTNGRRSRSPGR
jgi:hypothetical protein